MVSKETISARVCRSVDFEVPPLAEVPIEFDYIRHNHGGVFSEDYPARLTATKDGIYYINAQCIWDANADKNPGQRLEFVWQITIKINGKFCLATDRQYYQSWRPFNHCSTIFEMKCGDYVEMVAFWHKPLGVDVTSKILRAKHWDSPEFMMHRLENAAI